MKTRLSESEAEAEAEGLTNRNAGSHAWFGSSAFDSENLVFTRSEAERKRRNRKQNQNAVFTRS